MKNILLAIGGIIFIILVVVWIAINIVASIFPSNLVCHIVGVNGMAHVPANCLRYFLP